MRQTWKQKRIHKSNLDWIITHWLFKIVSNLSTFQIGDSQFYKKKASHELNVHCTPTLNISNQYISISYLTLKFLHARAKLLPTCLILKYLYIFTHVQSAAFRPLYDQPVKLEIKPARKGELKPIQLLDIRYTEALSICANGLQSTKTNLCGKGLKIYFWPYLFF